MNNVVNNPEFIGNEPDGWTFACPRSEISCEGYAVESGDRKYLRIKGNGDIHAISWWQNTCNLTSGNWYRATVKCRIRNIENPELSLFIQIAQHYMKISNISDDIVEMCCEFLYDNPDDGNTIEMYLRYTENGTADWFDPDVVCIDPPKHRTARVATTRFGKAPANLTYSGQLDRMARMLDDTASVKPDIVCLTELCELEGVDRLSAGGYPGTAESIPDGPTSRLVSQKAKQYGMYVIAGIVERDDIHIYNTAAIFGRNGELIGKYRKTHLTFGEIKMGVSCGSEYPVFDLDFGRIAVHICYDEWFPEVSRLYAHKGTEILFLPVAGGKPITWRTRAMDSNIYFVSSSAAPPSMIIDSSGVILTETHDSGFVYADLNLDWRKVNWYIDPTLTYGMPGIDPRMRDVIDHKCISELGELTRKQI